MNVIARSRFQQAAQQYPTDRTGLERVYKLLQEARPLCYQDLKQVFGVNLDLFTYRASANWVVIDVGGNNLRLIGSVDYSRKFFYVKHIYTHADYTKANVWYSNPKNTGTRP